MAGEMKPMNAPKSDSSSQSESDFCEENEQEEDKTKPMNLLANNGIHSTPTDKEEAPNRPFKYSHSRLPRPDTPTTLAFPMTRVRRLIRSEGDIRTNLEAAFLINKAVFSSGHFQRQQQGFLEWFSEFFIHWRWPYVFTAAECKPFSVMLLLVQGSQGWSSLKMFSADQGGPSPIASPSCSSV
eukprot:Gb_10608 [translate_table: standard]